MPRVQHLKCRECQKEYPKSPLYVCEYCFGPLEISYDYELIRNSFQKQDLKNRPNTMWRYKELLPLDKEPTVGLQVGGTPLVDAKRLASALGVRQVWIKNDAVCYPTHSFKDRVVAVALSKSVEFNFKTVACASTGNLANSVAGNAAAAGLEAVVFIPADLELEKILMTEVFGAKVIGLRGHYDDVNRLCGELVGVLPWAFANINIRPFYAEGSKTLVFETIEQLDWNLPDHFVSPMAGGSLITKIKKSIDELKTIGFLDKTLKTKIHGAQATGCAPIVNAWKRKEDFIRPEKPDTIAKSLAIGNPADGHYALQTIRSTQGNAESVTDQEILSAVRLLAETEGIFTETAGGVTLGVAKKLIDQGVIGKDESVVVAITGNGLKTPGYLKEGRTETITAEAKVDDVLKTLGIEKIHQAA